MDEAALQTRLDTIERQQYVILALLSGIYLLGGLWVLVAEITTVTVWNAGVAVVVLGLVASAIGMVRRRQAA